MDKKFENLINFLNQMLNADFTLQEALQEGSLESYRKSSSSISGECKKILLKIENGTLFYEALTETFTDISPVYKCLIKNAEESRNLNNAFKKIIEHMENKNRLREKFKNALIYPIFVLSSMLCVLAAIKIMILPKINAILLEIQGNADFTVRNKFNLQIMIFVIALFMILFILYRKKILKFIRERMIFVPVLKDLFIGNELLYFSYSMELLCSSGINVSEAFFEGINSITNENIKDSMLLCGRKIQNGMTLYESLKENKFVPEKILSWIKTGEKTGSVVKSFSCIRKYYEQKFNSLREKITALTEPATILITGIILIIIIYKNIIPVLTAFSDLIK